MTYNNKLQLKNVTLICVSDVKIPQSIYAIDTCMKQADFGAVKFLTSKEIEYNYAVKIDTPIDTIEAYSEFIIEKLYDYVDTKYCLIVQWDGFILNIDSWKEVFYQYDFIGAPYGKHPTQIGNGGFSFRSKRLLKETKELSTEFKLHKGIPEDVVTCHLFRPTLEARGIKYANLYTCSQFSTEGYWREEFGFHDRYLNPSAVERIREINPIAEPITGLHCGDIGDIIYCLPSIYSLKITRLALNPARAMGTNFGINSYNAIKPLLESQGFEVVQYSDEVHIDYYLDSFRRSLIDLQSMHLSLSQAKSLQTEVNLSDPYLFVPKADKYYDIIINKTTRYNGGMNYEAILRPFKNRNLRIAFIGYEQEYYKFAQSFNQFDIDYIPTTNLLEAMEVINVSKVFIGNQSSLFAIAEGLKTNRILEVCKTSNNSMPQTSNGFAWMHPYHDGLAVKFIQRCLNENK